MSQALPCGLETEFMSFANPGSVVPALTAALVDRILKSIVWQAVG
jgi:hypothetical protein